MWGLWVSRLMLRGKGQVYSWVARYFKGSPPQTGSPTALWQNYCREAHLLTSHPRGMLFVLGLLIPVFFFVRPVIPWDAVCVRLHLLSNPMLGFSALPLAIFDAGTPGWPIQVSPRMTSFIGMGHHPGPMLRGLGFPCLILHPTSYILWYRSCTHAHTHTHTHTPKPRKKTSKNTEPFSIHTHPDTLKPSSKRPENPPGKTP